MLPQDSRLTARARALSELAAGLAERDYQVVEFRNRALGGRLLTSEEAQVFPRLKESTRLVRRLASLHDWREPEALHFLLTGKTPQVSTLRHTVTTKTLPGALPHHTITLFIASWVPAEAVKRTYRQLQRELIPGRNRGPEELCWEALAGGDRGDAGVREAADRGGSRQGPAPTSARGRAAATRRRAVECGRW